MSILGSRGIQALSGGISHRSAGISLKTPGDFVGKVVQPSNQRPRRWDSGRNVRPLSEPNAVFRRLRVGGAWGEIPNDWVVKFAYSMELFNGDDSGALRPPGAYDPGTS